VILFHFFLFQMSLPSLCMEHLLLHFWMFASVQVSQKPLCLEWILPLLTFSYLKIAYLQGHLKPSARIPYLPIRVSRPKYLAPY
jgi:hypothetical protein